MKDLTQRLKESKVKVEVRLLSNPNARKARAERVAQVPAEMERQRAMDPWW